MFIYKYLFIFITTFTFYLAPSYSQTVWLLPENPAPEDTVTLFYNAAAGNGVLKDFKGDVYLHAGVITAKSLDNHDWKIVVGNWGKPDSHVKMERAGENLYKFTFVIKDFYNLAQDTKVHQLTFVFRNADGTIVGKDKHNNDFLIPVFGYRPPVKKKAVYLFRHRKLIDYTFRNDTLSVKTSHGLLQIIPLDEKIISVKNFDGTDPEKDSSSAVILSSPQVKSNLLENNIWIKLYTDSLQILIHKNPVFVAFVFHGDTLLREKEGYFQRSDNNGLQFALQDGEHLYGLGERAVNRLRGHRFQLYNQAHYGYEKGAENLNYSVPVLLSSKKHLLLFDNPEKGYADVGLARKNILELGAIGGPMKYVFIAGSSYFDIYLQYGKLTGRQPLTPRWALGNLQSRMAYKTQQETDSIVTLMQKKDFPVDAVILDFYWFGDSIKGTMGRLRWYKPQWPHPEAMIAGFRKKGVKTVLITEPYVLDTLENFRIGDSLGIFATDSSGKTYVNHEFYFGNGALIDIFKPEARRWFWQQYERQIKKGVAGWWGDLGEPESHPFDIVHVNGTADQVHNIYAHYWHKMLFENYRVHYPRVRLFNLNRAGYAGSQRYSIFPWTGDVSRSWGGLQAQLPLMIHMSLSGLPFIHSDAGGFAQGKKDDELYTRWLQMSCFSPVLRPHGSDIPSEPVFFNDTTQNIVRRFIKERYRLLLYLYTAAWKAHANGTPVVRPLFFDFPGDTATYTIFDEYMWGDDFLVAPVVKPGQKTKNIYLPTGYWYDWWTNKRYEGGKTVSVQVNLETIPVFVKAGAFIPMVPAVNSTDDYHSDTLTLRYYKNPVTSFSKSVIYEDDGTTFGNYENGNYELLKCTTDDGHYFEFERISPYPELFGSKRKIYLQIIDGNRIKQKSFKWEKKKEMITIR